MLTKPEDRLEQEPDWVRQAKDLGAGTEQSPVSTSPPAEEVPASADDTATWLKGLDQEEPTGAPLFENDATGMWLKSLDDEPVKVQSVQPAEEPEPELPAWMQNIQAEPLDQTSAIAEGFNSMRSADESTAVQPAQSAEQPEAELPAWLQNIEEEKPSTFEPVIPASDIAGGTQRNRSGTAC